MESISAFIDIVNEKNTSDMDSFAAAGDVCDIQIIIKKHGRVYSMFIISPINITIEPAVQHITYRRNVNIFP